MFEENKKVHKMVTRKQRKFKTKIPKRKRYQRSSIPYMTELLNDYSEEQRQHMKI